MLKKTVSYVISFLLVILLFIVILTSTISTSILNKKYIQKQINKSNYYEELAQDINYKFRNYIMQSGMEEVIFDGLFTDETLKNDLEKVLDAVYNKEKLEIDTTEIREKLNSNIEKYAQENNINLTIQNREQINAFEDTIIDNYLSSIKYSDTVINKLAEVIPVVKTKVNLILVTSIILSIIIIVILFLLNKTEKIKTLTYIGIALISVGGLILIALLYEKISLNLENSIILNKTLSKLLKIIITKTFTKLYIVSGINFIIGIMFLLYGNITKMREFR